MTLMYLYIFIPGADPKLRDHGRKLCAEEWAAYCGRRECADAIAKFSNTKSFYLKAMEAERSNQRLERSNSLPDLAKDSSTGPKPQHKRASLRKKIKNKLTGTTNEGASRSSLSPGSKSPFAVIARCVSTPVLPGAINPGAGAGQARAVTADNIPRVEVTMPPRDEEGSGADLGVVTGRAGRLRRRLNSNIRANHETEIQINESLSTSTGSTPKSTTITEEYVTVT